jgi:hypothetical protein
MRALQRINSGCFLAGYLGFLATFLLDTIYALLHKPGVKAASDSVKGVLRVLSPHYNLARCLHVLPELPVACSAFPTSISGALACSLGCFPLSAASVVPMLGSAAAWACRLVLLAAQGRALCSQSRACS